MGPQQVSNNDSEYYCHRMTTELPSPVFPIKGHFIGLQRRLNEDEVPQNTAAGFPLCNL